MSTVIVDLTRALERAVQAALLAPPISLIETDVAWPNVPFETVAGRRHARVANLHAGTSPQTVGLGGLTRRPGVMQVSLYHPLGSGLGAVLAEAQALCDAFKRGTRLTENGLSVLCERASLGRVLNERAEWVVVPVSIDWLVLAAD